ncbi:MAG: cbb3-type cytochrome c oxidase subunit I [Armatimonadetes bacterium]|nr:cbb3-type cytochrome c oxidase subunit I [Armatimonadota bacterium]MDW8121392.1 cbb3-type cytochrome c oxidase subunit I [Armatimonadota bacterium]
MFGLARRYVQTSLIFAIASTLLGMHMIAMRIHPSRAGLGWLPTAHGHLFLVGFVAMMIMGVAIWMFPRPKESRYSPLISEVIYWLITVGTAIRAIGEVIATYHRAPIWLLLSVIGGIAQSIAIIAFVINIWTRIRPTGRLLQEDREPAPKGGRTA